MIIKITDGLKYWGQLLLLPVYWLSFLVPRDKKIWLFGSTFGRRFADNPRYLYLYVSQNKEKLGIRPIWISHNENVVKMLNDKGYEAYMYHSFRGLWFALRGKVYLFDNYSKDINFWQSGGALKINLWHGIPLKKIQHDNIFDRFRHPKNMWERFKNFPRNISDEKPSHYVLTTSENLKHIFSSAFKTNNVLVAGYPRNEILVSDKIKNIYSPDEKADRKRIINFLTDKEDGQNKRMIFYMPTFRQSEILFFENFDKVDFQMFLEANNLLFCIKLHPKSKLNEEFKNIQSQNIMVINKDADPYVFLKMADVLITDYSSIYFDYLLLDRPVIFFDYDLKEYLSDSREMYFDYKDFTPGEKAENYQELKRSILKSANYDKEYLSRYSGVRKNIREKVFDCNNLIVDELLDILRKKDRIIKIQRMERL
mgnify:CR=1 FL=1